MWWRKYHKIVNEDDRIVFFFIYWRHTTRKNERKKEVEEELSQMDAAALKTCSAWRFSAEWWRCKGETRSAADAGASDELPWPPRSPVEPSSWWWDHHRKVSQLCGSAAVAIAAVPGLAAVAAAGRDPEVRSGACPRIRPLPTASTYWSWDIISNRRPGPFGSRRRSGWQSAVSSASTGTCGGNFQTVGARPTCTRSDTTRLW